MARRVTSRQEEMLNDAFSITNDVSYSAQDAGVSEPTARKLLGLESRTEHELYQAKLQWLQ